MASSDRSRAEVRHSNEISDSDRVQQTENSEGESSSHTTNSTGDVENTQSSESTPTPATPIFTTPAPSYSTTRLAFAARSTIQRSESRARGLSVSFQTSRDTEARTAENPAHESFITWEEIACRIKTDTRVHLYMVFWWVNLLFIIYGAAIPKAYPELKIMEDELGGFSSAFAKIVFSEGTLLSDATELGGLRAALIHSGIVGVVVSTLHFWTQSRQYGTMFATYFMAVGFSLMGKTLYNIWPFFIGVYIFSRVKEKDIVSPLVFSTSLSPIVSVFSLYIGFPPVIGIIFGWTFGILLGFCLASIAEHMLALHRGFTLYNIGTAAGFLGTITYMMMSGFELDIAKQSIWCTTVTTPMSIFLTILICSTITGGLAIGGRLSHEWAILQTTGKVPSDYITLTCLGGAMLNAGIMGLIGLLYVAILKADINGPIGAGVCALIGYGAVGKHPRNCIPIMLGVVMMGALGNAGIFYWKLTDPKPLLAALFSTSMAPISGVFGAPAGFVVGGLHLAMAFHIESMHGYLVLYNNGFAGGFVCVFFVGIINGLRPDLLETVAPAAVAAPEWTRHISEAYQSYRTESANEPAITSYVVDFGDESIRTNNDNLRISRD